MSLLLYILAKMVFFSVILVVVLTLLTWLTKSNSDLTKSHSLGEWPEDKATHVDRISARPCSSARQDFKDEQKRRRA
jgi:hypothetical protein